ncbi:hypothetical protein AX660_08070 [Paraglaciecola hydrolytica]|uniref:DUF3379 domain-containing protein n=2 Tax=Paraglaciecola hydrolytica TaxID=1799789 RepID=A0A136A414_9ALTE|nr:hypothetical protein AX660_08070 [Paraglaciecola hydrolytica]
MDDLEFRRALLADPKSTDTQVLDAIASDPKKLAFSNELKQLNQKMLEASQIKVPDGLAHRLLLRQSMAQHTQRRSRRKYMQFAMAASIAMVFGLSFVFWQQPSNSLSLSEHAIAHVIMEGNYALGANEDITMQQVNLKLARFGGEFTSQVSQVYYANYCDFNNVKSLHLVMQGESGKVSVFIVPHEQAFKADNLTEGKWNSQSFDFSTASLVVVSEAPADASSMKEKLVKSLIFSA